MIPQTLPEWEAYIGSLSGSDLLSKAMAANSLSFAKTLQEEGLPPSDITGILVSFARRLDDEEQVIPEGFFGEYLSYSDLLENLSTTWE